MSTSMLIMCPGSGSPKTIVANGDNLPTSSDVMETPLRAIPESKKSFLPSLSEKQKVRDKNVSKLHETIILTTGG